MGTWEANKAFEEAVGAQGSPEAERALAKAVSDGADVRRVMKGWSAPMYAAHLGRERALSMLIEAGADFTMASGVSGRTAATLAAAAGREGCLDVLAKAGADLEAFDDQGWNPLLLAALGGHRQCVRRLALAGVDLDARSAPKDGEVGGGEPWVSKFKLAAPGNEGVAADGMADQGLSGVAVAVTQGDVGMLSLLIEMGASTGACCAMGLDVRGYASVLGRLSCLAALDAFEERAALDGAARSGRRRAGAKAARGGKPRL